MIFKIHKKLKKLDANKPNNPIKKWNTELNREFSREESKVVEKYLKRMQIKTTMRFHLTPVRMARSRA